MDAFSADDPIPTRRRTRAARRPNDLAGQLAAAEGELAAAQTAVDTRTEVTCSGSLRSKARDQAVDAEVRANAAAGHRVRTAQHRVDVLRAKKLSAEFEPVPREWLNNAEIVQDRLAGWRPLVRINGKSVTVAAHGETERVSVERIAAVASRIPGRVV
jgi:hypothetical protein